MHCYQIQNRNKTNEPNKSVLEEEEVEEEEEEDSISKLIVYERKSGDGQW